MLLLNFFSSQPQSLLLFELVYCHSHFWTLSSLLSPPPKKARPSANLGVCLYLYATSAFLGLDVCCRGALVPNKAQIYKTISWHLIYLYTEIGCIGNRKHWRVLCKDCIDITQEGKEDVQVMVCSWAVTNTNKILYWNNHMWLGSNIYYGLNLWFSAS